MAMLAVSSFCIYNNTMITWTETKRKRNIKKHGIDLRDAEAIFDQPMLTSEDDSEPYGEQRLQSIGMLDGRVVFMVWTDRDTGPHIISIRKANRHEQKKYFKAIAQ